METLTQILPRPKLHIHHVLCYLLGICRPSENSESHIGGGGPQTEGEYQFVCGTWKAHHWRVGGKCTHTIWVAVGIRVCTVHIHPVSQLPTSGGQRSTDVVRRVDMVRAFQIHSINGREWSTAIVLLSMLLRRAPPAAGTWNNVSYHSPKSTYLLILQPCWP